MRLASTKIAQPEPSRRSALLSRAVVPTSSAGVAESRSGPRNRAVRWKLPSLLRITPGATSAAQGKKSASILGFLRYSARFSMGKRLTSQLHAKMRWIAEVSAQHVDELAVAPCSPDRRHVPDRPHQEAGDPQSKSQSGGSRQSAVSDRDRAGRAAKQDRLRQGAMDRCFKPGDRHLAHQTTAPPPKEKNDRKNELAANAMERPNTIWTRRRNPPEVSPKASVSPVTMMMITAIIFATGPSIDCKICCNGCSHGMFEPAA